MTTIVENDSKLKILADAVPYGDILTREALDFVEKLCLDFEPVRRERIADREKFQLQLDKGTLPRFLDETAEIRNGDWKVAPIPSDLQDRRVEITGPVDRKMIINALNSGAKAFMADLEDSHSPTWKGTMEGQINLKDAVRGTIEYIHPGTGKEYRLKANPAVLMVRPRGWHLTEKNIQLNSQPISGSLLDFGLYFFHNHKQLVDKGSGPYFYLPKMEHYKEARLWNDVFNRAQDLLKVPRGTIKATVLIETITAAFEMEEILYELRNHIVGLNCGRWDYIFSFIKRFRKNNSFLFPDRSQVNMTQHCMRSYSLLAIQTCHRRGAHAMGGMAAQIPIKNDPEANEEALRKVRADKSREAGDGHDGTWVAHPGLVAVAMEEFDKKMSGQNQVERLREDVKITAEDLLRLPEGTITGKGLRTNISVGIQYLAAWLNGNGCVPLYNLMEDAATAEISRTQVWQWIHHPRGALDDEREVTLELVELLVNEEMEKIQEEVGGEQFETGKYQRASRLFLDIVAAPELEEFLTSKAYIEL